MPSKYKLCYFNARGRAEVLRLTMAAAGAEFEDKRLEFKDWPAEKPKTPQGSLPYLVIDGKTTLPQSLSILRFLAREHNLYGKSNLESTWVDVLIDTLSELFSTGITAFFTSDEAKKKELIDALYAVKVPKFLDLLEKAANGKNGFLVGDCLTVADIYLYSLVENFKLTEAVEKFPKLKASVAKTGENKNIKKYLETRPVTQQ